MSDVIHEVYLPFSGKELGRHFMHQPEKNPEKNVEYFQKSAGKYCWCPDKCQEERCGKSIKESRGECQIEKDERFWTAATLMKLYHSADRVDVFARLLSKAFGETPPMEGIAGWNDCLSGDLNLLFEVDLPSPKGYSACLRDHLTKRQFIPYVLYAAAPPRNQKLSLEGPTQVDALLINEKNGFAVIFEAKVLSDISYGITFDVMRNQIARNIDVMLEDHGDKPLKRRPDKTLFVLLTPGMFKDNPHSRLYGWLFNDYKSHPACLARDIPHRADQDWTTVSKRLGWLTWEDCNEVVHGACPGIQCGKSAADVYKAARAADKRETQRTK